MSVILIALAMPIASFAGNGPSDYFWGEGEDRYYISYVSFYEITEDLWNAKHYSVFENNTVKNEMPGAVYDRATNTLTITDLDASGYGLSANMMGEDFKLVVKGECKIDEIYIYGDNYGGSLAIEGDGHLILNGSKNCYSSIVFFVENAPNFTFTIGDDVKVDMYSGSESDEIVSIHYTDKDFDPDKDILFGGVAPKYSKVRVMSQKTVAGYLYEFAGAEFGTKCVSSEDPDGEYMCNTWYSENPETGDYDVFSCIEVCKFIYSETYDCYFPDHAYYTEHSDGDSLRFYSVEDFENSEFEMVVEDGDPITVYYDVPNRMYSSNEPVYTWTDGKEYIKYHNYMDDTFTACEILPIPEIEGEFLFMPVESVDVNELEEIILETDDFDYYITGDEYHYPTATKFKDINGTEWYAEASLWCDEQGYMNGLDADHFGPKNQVTRGQFVLILAKIADADLDAEEYAGSSFSDVPTGKWYSRAVEWAYKNGYSSGLGNGIFGVSNKVSRQQLATFFRTYAKEGLKLDVSVKDEKILDKFTDSGKISGWAKEAVAWAVENGIISGTSETTVSPASVATRAQIAVIVKGFVEKLIGE